MDGHNHKLLKDKILKDYKAKVRSHLLPYEANVRGKSFKIIPPHVMSPKYSFASHFMAEIISDTDFSNLDVLDMGTGCGIQGIFSFYSGAKSVLGVDINPYAVRNATENFIRHGVNGKTLVSDIFNGVPKNQSFDTILFEAPYHNFEPASWLDYGVTDHKYESIRRFIDRAPSYLRLDGFILLGFSPFYGDDNELNRIIDNSPFQKTEISKLNKHDVSWEVTKLKI